MRSRSRRAGRFLGKLLAFLLLGVVLFEAGVRLLLPGFNINPSWRYHPVLGWTQVPGAQFDYEVDGERVFVGFNAQGFHDTEHEIDKPADLKRVVLVGDSFSESVQVNLEDTFFKLLEQRLNAVGGGRWEVINLGVGDFGTAQECLALETVGLRYAPDIVLCQIFPLNDVCNNSLALCDLCKSRNDRYRPYFIEAEAGLVQTSAQPLRSFLRRSLISYSITEGVLLRGVGAFAPQSPDEYRAALRARGFGGLEPMLQTFTAERDQSPAVAQGWRVTEALLERLVRSARDAGAAVLPIVVPWDQRIGPRWDVHAAAHPTLVGDYPERRLGALFDRLAVPCLMLRDLFERNREIVLPARAGHFNPGAHRLVAAAIFDKLRAEGLVP